jgi:probable HAF family extracellular repeat protein
MFMTLFSNFLLIFGMLAAAAFPAAAQQPAPSYSVTDLGTLGGRSSEALGLNSFGDVVGASTTSDGASHAFLYRGGTLVDLGTLPGGTTSRARAINDRGDIVGDSGINAYGPQFREPTQGFIWRGGVMRSLGALYCPCSFNVRYGTSQAFAVNAGGTIAGGSETNRGERFRHAVLWQEDTTFDLGSALDGFQISQAYGINEAGEVVGAMNNRAFLAREGRTEDLGVLPGHTTSAARSVNNRGEVVGTSSNAAGISRAFLWDLGTMRDLGVLPGHTSSEALGISVYGDVVGRSGNADFSDSRAVLWRDGAAIDLNTLTPGSGWTLTNATAINDLQHIVGVGVLNGEVRAFLLTPR